VRRNRSAAGVEITISHRDVKIEEDHDNGATPSIGIRISGREASAAARSKPPGHLRGGLGPSPSPDGRKVAHGKRGTAGVPTIPGSGGRLESAEAALALLKPTGFPVMIKAAGWAAAARGIRVARSAKEFITLMTQAQGGRSRRRRMAGSMSRS